MIITDEVVFKKSVIRWAGGKQWLTKSINEFIPKYYNNYHEPFLGGAAMFLFLKQPKKSFISDRNEELINFYIQVRDNLKLLLKELKSYKNDEEYYYTIRSRLCDNDVKRAARFYYLNKTGFNGIYRVNKGGIYNVPYGNRDLEKLFNIKEFQCLQKKLLNDVVINSNDFELSMKNVKKGDLVFLDPPYTVAHNNNGFIEYNQTIFSWVDQERLCEVIKKIDNKKAYFILTNAVHDSIFKLYKNVGKKFEIERHSTISGHVKNRKKVSELIITNCI
ncbi:DNA adenine methylase [Ferruginibacter sp.]